MIWLYTVVAVLVVVFVLFKWLLKRRLRMFEWNGRQSYIRFYPNPGWTVRPRGSYHHWCRHRGKGVH